MCVRPTGQGLDSASLVPHPRAVEPDTQQVLNC